MPIEFKGSLLIFGLLFLFSRMPGIARSYRLAFLFALTLVLLLLSKQLAACFTAGYVLAELVHASLGLSKWLRLASVAFMAASLGIAIGMGQQDDTAGALLAIGIVMAALFWPTVKFFLSNALSIWLGRLSFPLYLIHFPVVASAGAMYLAMRHNDMPVDLAVHVTVVLVFIACVFSAWLLLPVERLSIRLSRATGNLRLPRW